MSHLKFTNLSPELYDYLLKVSCRESKSLHAIRQTNDSHPQIRMQIAPDQAQFLQFLIRLIKAQNVLEIGCFLGYSAAAMAEALPENGKVITLDLDVKIKEIAESHWRDAGLIEKIELKIAPALDSLQELLEQNMQFDFIFIDADKASYSQYYQLAKKMLAPHGVIAIDNVFFHAEVLAKEPSKAGKAIVDFNRMLFEDPEVHLSMIPIADGLSLVQKK